MTCLKTPSFNPPFSHIYIEEKALSYPRTQKILSHFPRAEHIPIAHYKDVFNRSGQSYGMQKQSQSLILAVKENHLIYPGAPVCQDFGNQHFYYTSSVMNCIFDCEYCYLQGMYPSANLVIFVNLEDIFAETKRLLEKHPVYLCVSYDTDLLAMESFLGYGRAWAEFAAERKGLTIELRTKAALPEKVLFTLPSSPNLILAWTLSPAFVAASFEHRTPLPGARLSSAVLAAEKGYQVRLCFDPILKIPNWKEEYKKLIDSVFEVFPPHLLLDVSTGVFRLSASYLKQMRRARPDSLIVSYPFENQQGVVHYGSKESREMISYIRQCLLPYVPEEKIFVWEESNI